MLDRSRNASVIFEMRRWMQMKNPWLTSLFGLLLASTIPSYAQTDGPNAQANAVDAWKKKIVIRLMSKRGLPPAAAGQRGTAKVKFVIDRQGKLISKTLTESSGSELLDAAALTMVERAEPFPEPPVEVGDERITFMVPVVFAGRQALPSAGGPGPAEWVEEQTRVDHKIHGICRGC